MLARRNDIIVDQRPLHRRHVINAPMRLAGRRSNNRDTRSLASGDTYGGNVTCH